MMQGLVLLWRACVLTSSVLVLDEDRPDAALKRSSGSSSREVGERLEAKSLVVDIAPAVGLRSPGQHGRGSRAKLKSKGDSGQPCLSPWCRARRSVRAEPALRGTGPRWR